jgi:polyol permease family
MSEVEYNDTAVGQIKTKLYQVGILPALAIGYVGVFLFMVGDAVELGYLAPYLVDRGFSEGQAALVFTTYGAVVAFGSWLSGPLCERYGPHKVMATGFVIWIVATLIFLGYALPTLHYETIVLSYTLRGFGYPFFAFGFLIWIAVITPNERLGRAVGWFWFFFALGLPTAGAAFANQSIPIIGEYYTFWAALAVVFLGGLIGLFGIREPTGRKPLSPNASVLEDLSDGISILWRDTRVFAGGIVRVINTAPQFGFFIVLPFFFVDTVGFSQSQWLALLTVLSASNVICNMLFGWIGDWFGWRRTIALLGGLGCAFTTLGLYYGPLAFGQNYPLILLLGALYGATLAAYVPLSAIMPAMVGEGDVGNSMAILNLSAGVSTSVGPAIVGITLTPLGTEGVMVIFAGLYILSAIVSWLFLKTPADPKHPQQVDSATTAAD